MAVPKTKTCGSCSASVAAGAKFCGSCGSAVESEVLAGRVVADRYKVQSKLGEGGMGTVYRAEQISLKRQIALKVLKPELSNTEGLVRRFNAEAELAAKLNHPNTVTLYDFGQEKDGSLFIAMEFVEGRSLRQLIGTSGALSIDTTLFIAEQVCASLADAHAHGIVHRDLKPDNIMLTSRGKRTNIVRVLDFGIAKLRDDGRITANPMTQAGDLLGTPQYMAPEQVRGEKVDGRADVYAMGCMLYEMVTGKLPFTGPNVMAILGKHLTEAPQTTIERRPDLNIPPRLNEIIMQCLQKDAGDRQPSMEVLGEQLGQLRRQLGVPTPHSHPSMVTPGGAIASQNHAFAATAAPGTEPTMAASALHSAGAPVPSAAPLATPHPAGAAQPTAPPGAPLAPPQPAVPTPAYAATPAPTPASFGYSTTTTRTGSRTWLWLIAALLVLGGGGAAVYFSVVKDAGDEVVPSDFDTEPDRDIFDERLEKAADEADKALDELDEALDKIPGELPSDFNTEPDRDIL